MNNHAQAVVDQAAHQTAQIIDGSKLNLAFKTDSGKVILDSMIQAVATHLDDLVHEPMSDEEVLKRVYQMRGILQVLDGMGDAIKAAIRAVSRNAVSVKLRGRTALPQEDV